MHIRFDGTLYLRKYGILASQNLQSIESSFFCTVFLRTLHSSLKVFLSLISIFVTFLASPTSEVFCTIKWLAHFCYVCCRKGDYHRYLAEFATGNDRKEAAENSLVAYKAASDIAMTELPPTHPIRWDSSNKFLIKDSS